MGGESRASNHRLGEERLKLQERSIANSRTATADRRMATAEAQRYQPVTLSLRALCCCLFSLLLVYFITLYRFRKDEDYNCPHEFDTNQILLSVSSSM